MVHKEQILSEYLDTELDSTLRPKVDQALKNDTGLRRRYERLQQDQSRLRQAGVVLSEPQIAASRQAVWERLQSQIDRKPLASPFWRRSVFIPIPVLAAAAIVVFGSMLSIGFWRTNADNTNYAPTARQTDAGQLGVLPVAAVNPSQSYTLPMANKSDNLAVTIQVHNLDQLLSILEGGAGIKELTVKLPPDQDLTAYGAPKLIRSAER